MAKNYGISFCERCIKSLEEQENALFKLTGSGFTYLSQEHITLNKYKSLLKKFKREKELGLNPSYDPSIHGSYYE